MRIFLVGLVLALLAPSFVTASTREPVDTLPVSVMRIEGKGVYVAWHSASAAVFYDVYRGASLDDLQFLGRTSSLHYADFAPLDEDAWYVVLGSSPESVPNVLNDPVRGKCLALRGASGVALTLAHCMPGRLP